MSRANAGGATRQAEVQLTERQREVLRLIAAGKTNAEIGEALGISLDGAKWHVREIMSKLGVDSRKEAAEYWLSYNSLGPRFERVLRSLLVAHAARWAVVGACAAAVAAGGTAAGFLVVTNRDHDEQSGATTPVPTNTALPDTPSTAATFLFSSSTLDSHSGGPAEPSSAERIRSIRAFVGDVECDRVSLVDPAARDADGNAPLVVGLSTQPAPCRIPGATVTFVMSRGIVMYIQGVVVPGLSTMLQNLAPNPPGSPMYPSEETTLLFALPSVGPLLPSVPPLHHNDPKDITVFADGERCTRVSAADGIKVSAGYMAVPLGRAGQPAACSRAGATVLGYDQDGNQLLFQNDGHTLAPLTWMYMSGEADPGAPKRDPSELGPIETAWPH